MAPKGKTPARRPTPSTPEAGSFGHAFLQNLKAAPHGTADEAVVLQTVRSMSAEHLKATLVKGTPQERNLLFSAIPGDQIASILASLPAGILATAAAPSTGARARAEGRAARVDPPDDVHQRAVSAGCDGP